MTADDALVRLGQSTSDAVAGVLEMFAPGKVEAGEVAAVAEAFEGLPAPAVAASVSYVDGVTGGNVFVMTLEGARRLAAAMMGLEQPEDPDAPELSELELSAVSEAMNQMMASAANAIAAVLGTQVAIGTPETRTFAEPGDALGAYPAAPHAIRAAFTVCGEACLLIQLVPTAFVVRMTRALDEFGAELAADHRAAAAPGAAGPSLAGIPVRVWAELGRARMPSADFVGLPPGAVIELDRGAEEQIDLYVNGRRFATGRLMVVDDEWAVKIESIPAPSNTATESQLEVARWPESW